MPNNDQARKRVKINKTKMMQNKMAKSQLKTAVRRFDADVAANGKEAAAASMLRAVQLIDKAAAKKLIHKNNAARKKSQISLKYNAMN